MQKTLYGKPYQLLTQWLKEERQAQKITMRRMAELLAVQHSIIWNIENAERRLDIVEYINYCQVLRVDPDIGIDLVKQGLDLENKKV